MADVKHPGQRPRAPLMSVGELSMRLSEHAHAIVTDLYGVRPRGARVMLDELSGGEGTHISINLKPLPGGLLPGGFFDHRSKKGGDILDLVAHARFGGNMVETIKWAKGYLGLEVPQGESEDARRVREKKQAEDRRRLEEKQRKAQAEAAADAERRVRTARHLFLTLAQADIQNTPVASYMLHERGIDVSLLPSTGACRFAPECLLYETGELLPAMVLCVTGPNGKMMAVHRTYLEQANGVWRAIRKPDHKGKVRALRLCLGEKMGGHVSVSKGVADVPLGRAPQGDRVLIAEGYETAATYALACPGLRCISAVDLGNMGSVVMPETVTTRFLVKENGMKPEAEETFWNGVAEHKKQCDDVRVVETPDGYSDGNDVLRDKKMVKA